MIVLWTHRWTGWGWGREQALKPQLESLRGSIFGTHSTPGLSFPDPSTLSSPLHTKGPCVGVPAEAMHLYIIASPPQSLGMNSTPPGAGHRKGGARHQTGVRGQREAPASPPPPLPSHQPSPQIASACSFLSLPVPLPWPFYHKPLFSVSSFSPSVLLLLGCRVRGT